MKITFLNVGHGDSIVLEWLDKGTKKIGLVDCNNFQDGNPTIDYLKLIDDLKEFEFVALSHPHIDHYSGFISLFRFVEEKGIIIKRFIHTLHGDPKYLNWAETIENDRKKLQLVIDLFLELKDDKNIIKTIDWAILDWSIPLGDGYSIRTLSPSDSEIRTRKSKIHYYQKENRFLCSTSSNYLSTIFLIFNNDTKKYFLLTSDALDYSFERLFNSNAVKSSLFGTQIPHHGSSKSLYKKFWQNIFLNSEKKALISAGFNKKYKLPDFEVVEFFDKLGVEISITNQVHGYKEYFDDINYKSYELINALDDDSEHIVEKYSYQNAISVNI